MYLDFSPLTHSVAHKLFDMETKRPIRVLIVGAGLGGMAAAYCFAHHGHHVEVSRGVTIIS